MLALGAMRVPEAIVPLSEALDDWQLDTRMVAVQALGRTGLAEAAEPIIETYMVGGLKVPADPVANALVRCYMDQPEALLPYLRRSLGESRELLARVASELATPGMADEMILLAEDPQPEVRACAAKALAVAPLPVAIPALANLVRDDVWFVRLRAVSALNQIPASARDPDPARSGARFEPPGSNEGCRGPRQIRTRNRGNSAKHRRFARPLRAPRHDLRAGTRRRLRKSDGATCRSHAPRRSGCACFSTHSAKAPQACGPRAPPILWSNPSFRRLSSSTGFSLWGFVLGAGIGKPDRLKPVATEPVTPSCVPIGDRSRAAGIFCRGGCARGPGRARCWSCGDDGGAVRRAALRARRIPGAAPAGRFPSADAASPLRGAGRARFTSSAVMVSAPESSRTRSTTLRNSRTLPGHAYRCKISSDSGEKCFGRQPFCDATCAAKYSASAGISSARSRSGGRAIGKT